MGLIPSLEKLDCFDAESWIVVSDVPFNEMARRKNDDFRNVGKRLEFRSKHPKPISQTEIKRVDPYGVSSSENFLGHRVEKTKGKFSLKMATHVGTIPLIKKNDHFTITLCLKSIFFGSESQLELFMIVDFSVDGENVTMVRRNERLTTRKGINNR